MEAVLRFDLQDEDDRAKFDVMLRGTEAFLSLHELDRKLRDFLKYGHEFQDPDMAIEEIRQFLFDTMEQHNINLDMLV